MRFILPTLLLLGCTVAMACDGEQSAKSLDYFSVFAAADESFGDRIDATGDIDDEEKQEDEGKDAYRDFLADLSALEPIPEAADIHATLVGALNELFDLIKDQEQGNVDPNTAAENAPAVERVLELLDEMTLACQEIERIASDYGRALDLFCAESDQ